MRAGPDQLSTLHLRGAKVVFAGHVALNGINCDVPSGSICVVMGPNGSGKTTLIRVMAGVIAPTSGGVVWPVRGVRTRTALVAQVAALYPFLTIRENCLASGRMEGLQGRALASRVEAAVEQTLCGDLQHQLAGRLSGGYLRRAAIASALMVDAELLILDEPTTGLDGEATGAIVEIVRRLRNAGRTIVLTTHNFDLADALADVVMFLREGTLVAVGPLDELCASRFPRGTYSDFLLAQEPTEAQLEALAAMAATRNAAKRYSIVGDDDERAGLRILQQLQDAGMAIRELHLRVPGTAMLFERFCLEGSGL